MVLFCLDALAIVETCGSRLPDRWHLHPLSKIKPKTWCRIFTRLLLPFLFSCLRVPLKIQLKFPCYCEMHIALLNELLVSSPAVVLLNSKETQAELGWTSYPPNGVSLPSCIFHLPHVCLFACSLARLHRAAAYLTAGPDKPPLHPPPHPSFCSQLFLLSFTPPHLLIIPFLSSASLSFLFESAARHYH